jgi:hypothetical protein
MTWTDNDQRRAFKRGWTIHTNKQTGAHEIWAIRSMDTVKFPPRFRNGMAAAEHVLSQAFNGDRLCRKAVRHIILNPPR